jgi:hypothetical protein
MPTVRGFVERLEIGRAGLTTVALLHDAGSRANYVIPDLDADPDLWQPVGSQARSVARRTKPPNLGWNTRMATAEGSSNGWRGSRATPSIRRVRPKPCA